MEYDQPELDFNYSDVMMYEASPINNASVEFSGAPPSMNLTSPIDRTREL